MNHPIVILSHLHRSAWLLLQNKAGVTHPFEGGVCGNRIGHNVVYVNYSPLGPELIDAGPITCPVCAIEYQRIKS